MISHDGFMILSELERQGGSVKKSEMRAFCKQQNIENFDDLVEQLSIAKAIISIYSYIAIKSYINKNKKNNKTIIANTANNSSAKYSSKLISSSAKMTNVNYRAVVNGTSMRPNENQKQSLRLSRGDLKEFWLEKINEASKA